MAPTPRLIGMATVPFVTNALFTFDTTPWTGSGTRPGYGPNSGLSSDERKALRKRRKAERQRRKRGG